MLIGIDNAEIILDSCSRHKILYWLGFATVATVALSIAYALTRNEAFSVPFWLIFLPGVLLIFYAATIATSLKQSLLNEAIEQKLSGMNKRDYLGYKIGDDRSSKAFGATALSSTVLAGSSILGPFLRADFRT